MPSSKEYNKRKADLCVAFGICTCCKKSDAESGKRLCKECNDRVLKRERENRAKLRGINLNDVPSNKTLQEYKYENNLCLDCGKPLVDTKNKYCNECHKKHYPIKCPYNKDCDNCELDGDCVYINTPFGRFVPITEERKEYVRNWRRETYKKRKENNLCVMCGEQTNGNGVRCYKCSRIVNVKQNKRLMIKRRKQGIYSHHDYMTMGLCTYCGKPRYKKTKLCEKHYNMCVDLISKARKSENFSENWRNDDLFKWIFRKMKKEGEE